MGRRGPKSPGKLAVVDFKQQGKIHPPYGMTARARNLFKKIVLEHDPDCFNPEAVVLLRAFCEAENQHYLATNRLKTEGAVIIVPMKAGDAPRRNPWYDVMKESASTMAAVLTKLRKMGIDLKKKKPVTGNKRVGLLFDKEKFMRQQQRKG